MDQAAWNFIYPQVVHSINRLCTCTTFMEECLYEDHKAVVDQWVIHAGDRAVLASLLWKRRSCGSGDVFLYRRSQYHQRGITLNSAGAIPVESGPTCEWVVSI